MTRLNRRHLALMTAAALLATYGSTGVQAQSTWPTKPIRMIVPLAAGSAVDVAARIVAQRMSIGLGTQVFVENQPGASGLVGADKVAKAPPDGYTIGGFNDSIMTMVPALQAKMPWDILRDFAPVSLVATVEWGLVAKSDGPYQSVASLVAAAKASPGKIDFGSGGSGSPQHIAMALFSSETGTVMTHVPYKGATQAAIGVAGGEVAVAFQGLATVTPLLQGGRLKLLAVTTPKRMPQYPAVPTVDEAGVPGFAFNSWFAVLAPAGTPKPIIDRLHAEIVKALADPQVREQLSVNGLTPRGSSPEELGSLTREQLARYATLIRNAGIKPE